MTMVIEIPALDRLCAWLESRDKAAMCAELEAEIVDKLKEAATKPTPRPTVEAVPAAEPAHEPKPEPKPEPAPTVTLDAVQRAAAELRDQGKLKAVTGLFPEFEITKLSDLKGEKLTEFAGRLRQMGAKV